MDPSKRHDIVIIGAGGFAREVAWLIEEINSHTPTWRLLGFIETDAKRVGQPCGRSTVVGDDDFLLNYSRELHVVIGIGQPATIARIGAHLAGHSHLHFPNLIHPSVVWDQDRVQLGVGNIICPGVVLTTDIQLGSFNLLNMNTTFGHDVMVGDHCVFSPGVHLSGWVKVGNGCLVGAGAVLLERVKIGDNVTVGSGAVVVQNLASDLTVWGVPARPLMHKEKAQVNGRDNYAI